MGLVLKESGLLNIGKKAANIFNEKYLSLLLVFIGIMSSVASDAGTPGSNSLKIVLCRYWQEPLIGMAAAFAGVSAGFSANLILRRLSMLSGNNAQLFAALECTILGYGRG